MDEIEKQYAGDYKIATEKFRYYLIGITIASIGFAFSQTREEKFELDILLWLIAVTFWAISVFLGFKHIKLGLSLQYKILEHYKIGKGTSSEIEDIPAYRKHGQKVLEKIIVDDAKKAPGIAKQQEKTFYLGMVIYAIWHILNILLETHDISGYNTVLNHQ